MMSFLQPNSLRVGDKSNNVWVVGDHMTKIDRSYKYNIYISPSFSYTLQASISKLMKVTNSKRHALDGRTYHRISIQIPIRDQRDLRFRKPVDFLLQ